MPVWVSETVGALQCENQTLFSTPKTKFPASGMYTDVVKDSGIAQWTFQLIEIPAEGIIVGLSTRTRVKPGVSMRMLGLASTGELHNGVEPGAAEYSRPLEAGDQVTVLLVLDKATAAVWFFLNGDSLGFAFECTNEAAVKEGFMPTASLWGPARLEIVRDAEPKPLLWDQWQLLSLGNRDAPADFAVMLRATRIVQEEGKKDETLFIISTGLTSREWQGVPNDAALQKEVCTAIEEYETQRKAGVTSRPVRKVGGRYSMR